MIKPLTLAQASQLTPEQARQRMQEEMIQNCNWKQAAGFVISIALITINALAIQGPSFSPMELGLINIGLFCGMAYITLSENVRMYRITSVKQQALRADGSIDALRTIYFTRRGEK